MVFSVLFDRRVNSNPSCHMNIVGLPRYLHTYLGRYIAHSKYLGLTPTSTCSSPSSPTTSSGTPTSSSVTSTSSFIASSSFPGASVPKTPTTRLSRSTRAKLAHISTPYSSSHGSKVPTARLNWATQARLRHHAEASASSTHVPKARTGRLIWTT